MPKNNWTDEEARKIFANIDSYDKGELCQLLDEQITDCRPTEEVARLIAGYDEEIESVLYYKIIDADNRGDASVLEDLFLRLFEKMTDIFRYPEFFWDIGMRAGVPIEDLFLNVPFWKYEQYGSVFHTFYDRADYGKKVAVVRLWKTRENPRYDLLDIREKELEIQWSMVSVKKEKERCFSEEALVFYKRFFREELLLEDDEDLPEMLRHAIQIVNGQGRCVNE